MTSRNKAPECRISPSAPIDPELQRIGRAEIDFALHQVRGMAKRPSHAVHQCRKAIKRLRALVRLSRSVDDDALRELDRKLRNVGRLLAEARDADVIHRTASRLSAGERIRKSVEIKAAPAAAKPDPGTRRRVAEQLSAAGTQLDDYFAGHARDLETLRASLEKTYHKAARLMNRFGERDRQVLAHEWRKCVQRYANQLRLMADLCPERATELDLLDKLAKCLGEYNDLSILRAALKSGRIGFDKQWRSTVRKLAKARQRILRERALNLGESVFRGPGRQSAPFRPELDKDPHRWL